MDEADLAGAVKATVPLQTTVLALAVSGTDPQHAQRRAQAVLMSLSDQITQLETQAGNPTRVDVRILSAASLPAGSSLPSVPLAAVAGFALGLLLAIAGLAATYVLRPRGRSPVGEPGSGTPTLTTSAEDADPVVPSVVPAKAAARVPAKAPARTGAAPRKATTVPAKAARTRTAAPTSVPRAAAKARAAPSRASPVAQQTGVVDTDTPVGRITEAPAADVPSGPGSRVDRTPRNGSSTVGRTTPSGR